MTKKLKIGIAGNPNCGKTTLFNALTGENLHVGNWPGVTVDRKTGKYEQDGHIIEVVDLPGIYSLSSSSIDEQIARDFIINEKPDLILNIMDASNLERNLYLTIQLMEMKVPIILVLNMMDLAKQKKIKINISEFSRIMDVDIAVTVANKKEGMEELKTLVNNAIQKKHVSGANIYFPEEVESAIKDIVPMIEVQNPDFNARWLAIKLLENDINPSKIVNFFDINDSIERLRTKIEKTMGEQIDIILVEARYGFIKSVCKKILDRTEILRSNISDSIDTIVLNKYLGIPIFLLAMYVTFWLAVVFAGCFIDFFDLLFGAIFVDGVKLILDRIGLAGFFVSLIADGIGGGIQTVATFISPIFFIFLSLAVLEDSGYMARAAFIMDRFMRSIGLPGKAFVPMITGFGCTVPAIMAARTLDNQKDRTMTILINPFMSCGARLPVYALFAAVFFPKNGSIVVFSLYILGILMAVISALFFKNTILKGEASFFIMELPPYHFPTIKRILIHTYIKLKSFILKAGKTIIVVVLFLTIINSIKIGLPVENRARESILYKIGKIITPIFKPMGISSENWPATVGLISGVFAKEAIIGTLENLYFQIENNNQSGEDENQNIKEKIKEAFLSIPQNLSDISLPFVFKKDKEEVPSASKSTYERMIRYFDGKAGAYAYLIFVLLYMPCVAAMACVYHELSLKWSLFSAAYLTTLAWMTSTLFYQSARFTQHPFYSSVWIVFVLLMFLSIFYLLKRGVKT